jgi:hypothetical protein
MYSLALIWITWPRTTLAMAAKEKAVMTQISPVSLGPMVAATTSATIR